MKKSFISLVLLPFICLAQPPAGLRDNNTSGVDEVNPGKTYAVVIGISKYKEVMPLNFANKDARIFSEYLLSKNGMNLDSSQVKTFLDEKASIFNIGNALSDIISQDYKKGDRVIFFFAGHGDYDAKIFKDQALLLLYGAPKQNYFQNIFSGDFISTADLNSRFIEPLTSKGCEVVLIVDACHASGLNRNLSGGVEGGKITMMALENMTSPVKMYSCQASQYSLESEQWGGGRGLFSYVLMEGLYGLADANNDKVVSLRELQRYLEDNVPSLASPNKQDPIIKIENPKRAISKVNEGLLNDYKVQKSKNLPFMARADIKGSLESLLENLDTTRQRLYKECEDLISKKELEAAYKVFTEFAKIDSTSELSLQLRRNLSAALQEKTAAILTPMLEDASKVDVTREEVMLAIDDLEKATKLLGPSNFLYKNLVARMLFLKAFVIKKFNVKGNPDEALSMLEESAKLEPNAPYTYYYMGLFHRDKREQEKSKKNFKQYVDLIPSSGWAYNNLAFSDMDAGSFDEAISNYQQAIKIFKDSTGKKGHGYVTSMNNLGMVYTKLGQFDKAEPLFVDANKFKVDMVTVMNFPGFPGFPGIPGKPDSMHAVNNLGKLYVRKGEYDKAEPILITSSEEAKKIFGTDHPAYARTIIDLGELKGKKGNYDEAMACFDQAMKIMDKMLGEDNPRSAEIYFQKGVVYLMEKDNAKAFENFEKAFQRKYHDLKNIELNKALDPIRADSDFKKLMKKYFSEKELERHPRIFSQIR